MRRAVRRQRSCLIGLCLAGCATLSTCAAPPPPNILLLVVDSLRADRLDFYRTGRELTPFLASLATHATVFWNAYAQSSWTLPSVASLWTSRYQSQHRVLGFNSGLAESEDTLAEVLKQHGYVTACFSANVLLAKSGFAQGFDHYKYFPNADQSGPAPVKESADSLNQKSLVWLDALRKSGPAPAPFFLYLHYMEPHFPYFPPAAAFEKLLSRRADPERERQAYGDMLFVHRERWQHPDAVAADLIHDLYDGEVLAMDTQLQPFFAALEQRGLLRNTVVVITADHGEELLDHGGIGHGRTLYNEVTHIPLLFMVPGQSQRIDIQTVTSEVDIAPTLLDVAAIPVPLSFAGHSQRAQLSAPGFVRRLWGHLNGLLATQVAKPAVAFSELLTLGDEHSAEPPLHVRALVVDSHKLTLNAWGQRQTYDLTADPQEQHPDALSPTDRQTLNLAMTASIQRAEHAPATPRTETVDEETKARMRALGY